MKEALIGLGGIIVGILLNEYFRRRSRIEGYTSHIFEKRLKIYEALMTKINPLSEIAEDVIENPDYSKQQRHEIVSAAILDIANFTDENQLYVNENIAVHCTALLMGVEDICYIEDEREKQKRVKEFYKQLVNAKNMIKKESGVKEVNRLFASITKARHRSPAIDCLQELKKRQKEGEIKQ